MNKVHPFLPFLAPIALFVLIHLYVEFSIEKRCSTREVLVEEGRKINPSIEYEE